MDHIPEQERKYSIVQVAEILGKAENTVRKYESDYNIHISRDDLGRRVYKEEDLMMLKTICSMKDQGANIHVIRKALNRNPEVLAYKEKNIESASIRDLSGAEFLQLLKMAVSEVTADLQEQYEQSLNEMKEHFNIKAEEIREEIKAEFQAQAEQQKQENSKLMDYIGRIRTEEQEKKTKGLLGKFKGLIGK